MRQTDRHIDMTKLTVDLETLRKHQRIRNVNN